MSTRVSRRTFLGNSSKAAVGAAAVTTLLRDASAGGANHKHTVALIGCGGMGQFKMGNFIDSKRCEVLAVCDVDPAKLKQAAKSVTDKGGKTPKMVERYEEVVENKDIDIVIVATPDHWHAHPMMAAVANEKDVYCEKPCCHNIKEGRAMLDAATKYKRVVQVGTHQRSIKHLQQARDFIREGKLGVISQTNTFTYGNDAPDGLGHEPDTAPPEGVNYERWLGPAPVRPFNMRRFHSSWRWYFDYASGMVGDWNVHLMDIIMWSMQVSAPRAVSTSGGKFVLTDDRDTPDTMQAVYEFGPAKNAPKGFTQTYTMRKASGRPWSAGGYGMDLHGTKGKCHLDRGIFTVEGDAIDWQKDHTKRIEDFENKSGNDLQGHADHVADFLDCVEKREKPIATIESHYNTVVACHLANVSLRVGRKIFWDDQRELCFTDAKLEIPDKDANQLLTREYRKGYELPEV